MSDRPLTEFGRRRPPQHRLPDAAPAPKRSRHVALLVMGTMAVGGTAYALMGHETCRPAPPPAPGMAAPAQPQGACTSRGSSTYSGGGSGRSWSSFHFYGGDSSSRTSTSGVAESGSVSRGGFGGFAHAFGSGGG
jgi:hypothetical protein